MEIMSLSYAIKVSEEDYKNIATAYQWQVPIQGHLQVLDVAVFHYKNSKFVLEFTGNVDNVKIPDKKICVIDVEDQIYHVTIRECAGRGDNAHQKRFKSKKPFRHAIKLMRFVMKV